MTRPPLIRQGEGQAAAILRHHKEHTQKRQDFEKIINTIHQEAAKPTGKQAKRTGHRSAEGDHHRLRGIPVLAEGVGSAIPGSNPLAALLAKERRLDR